MKSSFSSNLMVFMAIMVASMQLYGTMAQTTHVVGDTMGWTIPQGGATAYTTWASQQTFTVGDILVFNFANGAHDVAEVSAAAYDPCTSTNPISLSTTSPTSLTLTTAGTHYYICTFTSHCQIGQKLTINVSAAATTPPTTPTTPTSPPTASTPPSMTPTTPASPPTATPTPPSTTPMEPCPPTSSPSSSPMSPPTATSGNTTPPPSNGAPSFTFMVPATLLAMGLVFLNY
ncbi:hypothetical protein SSX86_010297 [Deinandra increscens subsp. villosa]|uniref:Phytocyanin domain-containing protein n=1 Tax=Deinandra increscens subsp. villosa TaxID=3103831 RepID=A0AAP0H2E1_9ASTR